MTLARGSQMPFHIGEAFGVRLSFLALLLRCRSEMIGYLQEISAEPILWCISRCPWRVPQWNLLFQLSFVQACCCWQWQRLQDLPVMAGSKFVRAFSRPMV